MLRPAMDHSENDWSTGPKESSTLRFYGLGLLQECQILQVQAADIHVQLILGGSGVLY